MIGILHFGYLGNQIRELGYHLWEINFWDFGHSRNRIQESGYWFQKIDFPAFNKLDLGTGILIPILVLRNQLSRFWEIGLGILVLRNQLLGF